MARILLVHGSCHGAWCWQDVLPYPAGHEASAIDLPRLCTDDHRIPPKEQEKMVRDWPESDIIRLDCGHSPFFACPETLGGILDTIAKGST